MAAPSHDDTVTWGNAERVERPFFSRPYERPERLTVGFGCLANRKAKNLSSFPVQITDRGALLHLSSES